MEANPVPAAQIIIAIIPIVGIVMTSVLVFFYLLWRNKQIILQIETKSYIPSKFNLNTFCLISGILLVMIGIVLSTLFMIIDGLSYILLGGLVPLSCGMGLLFFYLISSRLKKKADNYD